MSMMQEIEKMMGDVDAFANFRVINIGSKSVYIEGINSVVYLGETEMQFQLKKTLLVVKGENLKVKYLDNSTCVLNGNIKAVETLWK